MSDQQSEITQKKVLVPTQGTIDSDMLEFINEVSDIFPREVLEEFYGFANRIVGLAKFTPNQAAAFVLRAQNISDMAIISIPAWKVSPALIIKLENFVSMVRVQAQRATTLDQRNERSHIATQGSISEVRNGGGNQILRKKKFLGIF